MVACLVACRSVLLVGVVTLGGAPQVPSEPAPQPSIRAAVETSAEQIPAAPAAVVSVPQLRRPALLAPMYGSYIGLQALDIHSTRAALRTGSGREGNPLMKGAVQSSASLILMKAASTAGVIWGAEKLSKKHRVAAVLMMVGVNSATAFVVARNYRISR